jgi:hypothetical protein
VKAEEFSFDADAPDLAIGFDDERRNGQALAGLVGLRLPEFKRTQPLLRFAASTNFACGCGTH